MLPSRCITAVEQLTKPWTLYFVRTGTFVELSDKEAEKAKRFYKIKYPAWDSYYQQFDDNNFHNARYDIYLWRNDEK